MAESLERQLLRDEGMRLVVYKDHLGKPTVGVGHLVLPKDNIKVGDEISHQTALKWFREDVKVSKKDARNFLGEETWKKSSPAIKNVVTNMAFNLGGPRLGKFKKLKAALDKGDYKTAAAEMKNSKWYKQVPNRAQRLMDIVLEEAALSEGKYWVEGFNRSDGVQVKGHYRNIGE